MNPTSSFIFENIPFHLKHHLLFKTKSFLFSKAILSIRKPFNKTGNQGRVNNSKEGNAAIGLIPNSYHLMHHLSDKEFKITRKR
jgi:fatty acid desaturase